MVTSVARVLCVASLLLAVSAGFACGSFSETAAPAGGDGGAAGGDAGEGGGAAGGEGDGGAAAGTYCAQQTGAAFCSDFDGVELLGEWSTKTEDNGGRLVAMPSPRSAPNGLRASTPAFAAGPLAVATLSRRVQGDVSKLSLTFDVSRPSTCVAPNSTDAVSYVELRGLDRPGGPDGSGKTALLVTKSGPKLFVKNGEESYVDLVDLPNVKPWATVSLTFGNGTASVAFDGQAAGPPTVFALTSTSFELVLGVTAPPGSGACVIGYDNVVVRLGP